MFMEYSFFNTGGKTIDTVPFQIVIYQKTLPAIEELFSPVVVSCNWN